MDADAPKHDTPPQERSCPELFDLGIIKGIVTAAERQLLEHPNISFPDYLWLRQWLKAMGELSPIPIEVVQLMQGVKDICGRCVIVGSDEGYDDDWVSREAFDDLQEQVDGLRCDVAQAEEERHDLEEEVTTLQEEVISLEEELAKIQRALAEIREQLGMD